MAISLEITMVISLEITVVISLEITMGISLEITVLTLSTHNLRGSFSEVSHQNLKKLQGLVESVVPERYLHMHALRIPIGIHSLTPSPK